MKIQVSEITDEGLDLTLEEALESSPVRLLGPVKAQLHLDRIGSEVVARGEARALFELQCSRCLKNYADDTVLPINVVYRPAEELRDEQKHEIKEDELETGFYRGDELDIQELVSEQILLTIPMKPLCSESCKGICPHCGTDLNTSTCTCEEREVDPRLAVLKNLLRDRKE